MVRCLARRNSSSKTEIAEMFRQLQFRLCVALATMILVNTEPLRANHGPGTSGGGSSTASGETLKQGTFDLSLREDYAQFQDIGEAGAERRALSSGGFDALRSAFIVTGGIAYGITDDFQVSASIGYYWGDHFIDASSD